LWKMKLKLCAHTGLLESLGSYCCSELHFLVITAVRLVPLFHRDRHLWTTVNQHKLSKTHYRVWRFVSI